MTINTENTLDKLLNAYTEITLQAFNSLNISYTLSTDEALTNDFEFCYKHFLQHNCKDLFVSALNCDNTVFNTQHENHKARALHDYIHFLHDYQFTLSDETLVANETQKLYDKFIANKETAFYKLVKAITHCEIIVQALHLETTGNFVSNQRQFTKDYLVAHYSNLIALYATEVI